MGFLLDQDVVENLCDVLKIYSDGTIFRSDMNINTSLTNDDSVFFKDMQYDQSHDLHVRLYRKISQATSRLPILIFIHGGGFCVGSRSWPSSHNCCLCLASVLNALVLALDYRLAPEHRLPAAMKDAFTAMMWLKAQALIENGDAVFDEVDFNKVFILGDSSGGNIAHHLAVRLGGGGCLSELAPVRIRGYVLLSPFFGGQVRTISEAGPSEADLNLEILDRVWRLSLPLGENRDHPYANPFGPESPNLEELSFDPMLVVAGENELLKDRIKDYALRLKEMGKNVDYVEIEGKQHGFFNDDPSSDDSKEFLKFVEKFISENSH